MFPWIEYAQAANRRVAVYPVGDFGGEFRGQTKSELGWGFLLLLDEVTGEMCRPLGEGDFECGVF